ncbi:MAG: hypothetical protein FJY82_10785 [Candidatus Aminicenantes bacterium]|nr:hypothetical protein [Candidatus Aminicenantes bacterium]
MTKKRLAAVFLALSVLLVLSPAAGSEEGGAHGPSDPGTMGKVVNFVILFGALFFALRKPLFAALAGRTEGIRSSLKDAREARLAAEAKLEAARREAASLAAEVGRIKAAAEKEGAAERDRIRTAAEAEAARIKSLAVQDVEARLKAGLRELKAFAASLAAGLAEERIRARMTAGLQDSLIDRSIERLGSLHEKSGSR